ncbi:MAG: MFS transporter [Candidatus Thorarchaeota archaeon]
MESSQAAPAVELRSKGYIIFLVVVMGLVSQLDGWLSLIESTAVPFITTEFFAGDVAQFALWQGLFGILVFLVFFIGWFGDAFGRKKGILLLTLVMGIPTIFITFLPAGPSSAVMFFILYSVVIMGTTSNLWEVPISEEAPAKSRGLYGSIAFLIGIIPFSAIIGVGIIADYGWRWGYGVMFFFMIFILILMFFMKEPQRWVDTAAARTKRLGVMDALKSLRREDRKYIAVSIIVYLAWTISFKMATTFGGQYYIAVQGYSIDQWKSVVTIAGLLLPVSALVSGILLDKIGRNIVLIIGTLGSVVCLILLGLTGLTYMYQGAYFFMAMVLAWIYVYLAEIFPTEVRATSIGVCVTGARFGYVFGPLIASLLLTMFPLMDGFWIVAGLIMLVPLVALLFKPLETKGKTLEEIEVER